VVDQEFGQPSYLILPASYIELPRHQGIYEIWPMESEYDGRSVAIVSHRDQRMYKSSKAGNMQGRLYAYPEGPRKMVFGTCDVGKKFSEKFGVRLAIRDSSMIDYDEIYPIPADKQKALIMILTVWFRSRREQPTDRVRDSNDNA
jgi:hypothetical protein